MNIRKRHSKEETSNLEAALKISGFENCRRREIGRLKSTLVQAVSNLLGEKKVRTRKKEKRLNLKMYKVCGGADHSQLSSQNRSLDRRLS